MAANILLNLKTLWQRWQRACINPKTPQQYDTTPGGVDEPQDTDQYYTIHGGVDELQNMK